MRMNAVYQGFISPQRHDEHDDLFIFVVSVAP